MSMGFSDDLVAVPRRIICSVEGKPFTGKTHFSLTAPEPILFFNVDLGTEGVVHKFQKGMGGKAGKQILVHNVQVPKLVSTDKDRYTILWKETKDRIKRACDLSKGTMVLDTETEVNELARLAHFGKTAQVMPHQYGEVNRELRDLMDEIFGSKLSCIFIRKMKPKWVGGNRTSEYEGSGWSDMEYKCQVNLTMYREDTEHGPEFSALIKKCRQNPSVNDRLLVGPMNDFGFLLNLVHGVEKE